MVLQQRRKKLNRQKDINSGENAVIFDLEKQILVRDGLSNVPYGENDFSRNTFIFLQHFFTEINFP